MRRNSLNQTQDLKPCMKGDFIKFSALYASINAIRLAIYKKKNLTWGESRTLMIHGLDFLNHYMIHPYILSVIEVGGDFRLELIRHLIIFVQTEWDINIEIVRFHGDIPDMTDPKFEDFVCHHLNNGNPVCIDTEQHDPLKRGEHHSVIKALTPSHIELFDSSGLTKISREGKFYPENLFGLKTTKKKYEIDKKHRAVTTRHIYPTGNL